MAEILKPGLQLIAEERQRQVAIEGWTAEHDEQHGHGQLALAAYSYEWSARTQLSEGRICKSPPPGWPWSNDWWKPKSPLKDYIRAGALYMAEADRCTRAAGKGDAANMGAAKMATSLVHHAATMIDYFQANRIE